MEHLELSSAQTVDAMLAARRRSWMAEAEHFMLAAHFADLHAVVPEYGRVLPGQERLMEYGADGTPGVAEFAPMEVAAALNITKESAQCLIGDALSLRHRFPQLWSLLGDGLLRVGVARSILSESDALPLAQALELDRRLVPLVEGVSAGRLVTITKGLVLDLTPPELAQSDHERAQQSRGVWFGQSAFGVTQLGGSVNVADAIFLDAQLTRFAQILQQGGNTDSLDVRRSIALGLLATPARALQLAQAALTDELPGLFSNDGDAVDPDCPARGQRGHTCGTITVDPDKLLPKTRLNVHVDQNTLAEHDGIARVEQVGPVLAEWLRELVGHTRITLAPTIDSRTVTPTDSYEISHHLRQVVIQRNPAEVFPGSKRDATRCDLDHTIPWTPPADRSRRSTGAGGIEPHGPGAGDPPPPPTRPDNLGPLSRTVHRAKTHGGWQLRQISDGCFHWTSPDGFQYLVTPSRSWMIHNPVTPAT